MYVNKARRSRKRVAHVERMFQEAARRAIPAENESDRRRLRSGNRLRLLLLLLEPPLYACDINRHD